MKKIAFFGGSGGLGSQVIKFLDSYDVNSISSNAVNFTREYDISNYFARNPDTDVVVIFSNYNHNSFIGAFSCSRLFQKWKRLVLFFLFTFRYIFL